MRAVSGSGPEDSLLDLIDEALDARVINQIAGPWVAYEFGHALIHRFLYDSLSTNLRLRLHSRSAETLERLYGDDADAHAAELAHHFHQAGSLIGLERTINYSMLAGQRALAAFAPATALDHYRQALTAKKGLLDDVESGEILLGLGRAHEMSREPFEAVENLIAAFNVFEANGEIEKAIETAKTGIHRGPAAAPAQADLCAQGLALAEPGSLDAAQILVEYGAALRAAGKYDRSDEMLERAIVLARDLEDLSIQAHSLIALGFTLIERAKYSRAADRALEALDLAYSIEPPSPLRGLGRRLAAINFTIMGEITEAKTHLDRLFELEPAMPPGAGPEWDYYVYCQILLAEGKWDDAVRMASRRNKLFRDTYEFGLDAHIEFTTGDPYEGLRKFKQSVALSDSSNKNTAPYKYQATSLAVVGRFLEDSESIEIAEQTALGVLENPHLNPELARVGADTRSVCAISRQDSKGVSDLYRRLEKWRGTWSFKTPLLTPDRQLALLAATMNKPDTAIRHFEEAIRFCRNAGFRPELAWLCLDYARFQLDRGGRIDRAAVLDMVNEGLEITADLGMSPLCQRLKGLRDEVGSISGRPIYPDGLTRREVEVLRLVAAGRSNREIADDLVITEGTAAKHVGSILGKTGAANRAEAATYAGVHGLFETSPAVVDRCGTPH